MKKVLLAVQYYQRQLHKGVARFAIEAGWNLDSRCMFSPDLLPQNWKGDGIITMVTSPNSTLGHYLANYSSTPIVNMEMRHSPLPYPKVLSDVDKAAEMAFNYFRGRGFNNFATFGGANSFRLGAFKKHVMKNDYECRELPVNKYTDQGIQQLLKPVLPQLKKPTAILCNDDPTAQYFINMAVEAGYKIPEDYAVLGMDNEKLICETSAVKLSSIDTNFAEVGYQAAALLDKLMAGEKAPQEPIYIPPRKIVQRASTDLWYVENNSAQKALEFMQNCFHEFIDVTDIANHAGISRRSLETLFRQEFDKSPGELLKELRLKKAVNLLTHTNRTIADIANSCGFVYPKNFTTLIRKTYGITPKEMRKKTEK